MAYLHDFMVSFTPLFFAMNILGIMPTYISMTASLEIHDRKKLLRSALAAALLVATVIIVAGKLIFTSLSITADDFRIGGGLILLLIAIMDLLFSEFKQRAVPSHEIGVVPIGIPLIIGPAALTTLMMLVDRHGYLMTISVLVANLGLTWLVFDRTDLVVKAMGKGGSRAFGKVASIFLAAIAIMMIRVGITNLVRSFN